MRTHYDVLGVDHDAARDAIKRAWRVKVQLLHPDRHQGASDEVRAEADKETLLVNRAWEVLGDTQKRGDYDLWLATSASAHAGLQPPPGTVQVVCARCGATQDVRATARLLVCETCGMAWRFERCDGCRTYVRCDERWFGRRWRCPKCKTMNVEPSS